LLSGRKARDEARPTEVPVLQPLPTPSASVAQPERFNQADPTQRKPDMPEKPGKP
jgi:hypothetical protein